MKTRMRFAAAFLATALAFGLAACGDDDETAVATPVAGDGGSPAAGMCPQENPDCVDTDFGTGDGEDPGDATSDPFADFPADEARDAAHAVLGMYEDELSESVRIGRRGDETFALTEDYVLGRLTVELDDTDGDGYRVTSVTVELPDGPETYQLEAG